MGCVELCIFISSERCEIIVVVNGVDSCVFEFYEIRHFQVCEIAKLRFVWMLRNLLVSEIAYVVDL